MARNANLCKSRRETWRRYSSQCRAVSEMFPNSCDSIRDIGARRSRHAGGKVSSMTPLEPGQDGVSGTEIKPKSPPSVTGVCGTAKVEALLFSSCQPQSRLDAERFRSGTLRLRVSIRRTLPARCHSSAWKLSSVLKRSLLRLPDRREDWQNSTEPACWAAHHCYAPSSGCHLQNKG